MKLRKNAHKNFCVMSMVLFLMFQMLSLHCEKTQGKMKLHREITGKIYGILLSKMSGNWMCHAFPMTSVLVFNVADLYLKRLRSEFTSKGPMTPKGRLSTNDWGKWEERECIQINLPFIDYWLGQNMIRLYLMDQETNHQILTSDIDTSVATFLLGNSGYFHVQSP